MGFERLFKSLKNARRIASISNEIKDLFESLSFATANEETILHLVNRVKEVHGNKVAGSLIEELPEKIETEKDFFRVRNIISIARGFLEYRETMKKKVKELAEEKIALQNKVIMIRAVPASASSTPWRMSIHDRSLLICEDDLKKARKIQKRIDELQNKINSIKHLYFINGGGK